MLLLFACFGWACLSCPTKKHTFGTEFDNLFFSHQKSRSLQQGVGHAAVSSHAHAQVAHVSLTASCISLQVLFVDSKLQFERVICFCYAYALLVLTGPAFDAESMHCLLPL